MSSRRLVFTFGLLTSLFAAGYGVMFTVLDDFRDQYGISETALGAIVAMGFFSSFLAQVLIAPLADRGRARQLVYIAMVLNVVGLVGMAVGRDVPTLLGARFVMGVGVGMAVPAVRRIVILADPEHLGSNLGRLVSADVAGFAAGPAISAILVGPFGIASPFLVIAAATLVCLPVLAGLEVVETTDPGTTRFAFDLLRSRPYDAALLMGSAVFLMIGTFDALWAVVLDDLGTSVWLANAGITLFAIPFIVLASFGGRLAQRVGPFRLATVGLLFGSVCMTGYGYWPSGGFMFAAAIIHAIGDGLTISSSGVAVGMVVSADRQAAGQGLLGGAQTLVGGATAITAGWLYQHHGRATAYTACGIAMAVFTIVAVVLVGSQFGMRGEPDSVTPHVADPVPT
jgi:MFS family permease